MSSTYRIDLDALTIIRTDAHGEDHDLNAEGEPCRDFADLLAFASDLGLTICKYADPVEDAREGLAVDEATDIMREDPSLIYVR